MVFPKFLRIATLPKNGISSKNESALMDPELYDFVEFMFIKMLSQALRFPYKLVLPDDGEYGRRGKDGNWTGLVGMVERGEADFFIRRLGITLERSEVVDFSFPYHVDPIVFAKKRLEASVKDNTAFLKPFSSDVWIAVLVCSCIVAFVYSALFRRRHSKKAFLKKNESKKGLFKVKPRKRTIILIKHSKKDLLKFTHSKKGLLKIKFVKKDLLKARHPKNFTNEYRLFLQNSLKHSQNNGERILRLAWLVSTTFLRWSYTAVVLSFLTFPSLTGVRTINELAAAVREGKYQCITLPGSFIGGALIKSGGTFEIIGNSVSRTKGSGDFEEVLKQKGYSKPTAIIATEVNTNHLREKYFVSQENFFEMLYAVGIRKHFCCVKQLNIVINYISSAGLYLKLLNEWKYKETFKIIHRPPFYDDIKQRPLAFEDLKGTFILLAVGYLLAIAAYVLEVLVKKLTS